MVKIEELTSLDAQDGNKGERLIIGSTREFCHSTLSKFLIEQIKSKEELVTEGNRLLTT